MPKFLLEIAMDNWEKMFFFLPEQRCVGAERRMNETRMAGKSSSLPF